MRSTIAAWSSNSGRCSALAQTPAVGSIDACSQRPQASTEQSTALNNTAQPTTHQSTGQHSTTADRWRVDPSDEEPAGPTPRPSAAGLATTGLASHLAKVSGRLAELQSSEPAGRDPRAAGRKAEQPCPLVWGEVGGDGPTTNPKGSSAALPLSAINTAAEAGAQVENTLPKELDCRVGRVVSVHIARCRPAAPFVRWGAAGTVAVEEQQQLQQPLSCRWGLPPLIHLSE